MPSSAPIRLWSTNNHLSATLLSELLYRTQTQVVMCRSGQLERMYNQPAGSADHSGDSTPSMVPSQLPSAAQDLGAAAEAMQPLAEEQEEAEEEVEGDEASQPTHKPQQPQQPRQPAVRVALRLMGGIEQGRSVMQQLSGMSATAQDNCQTMEPPCL